MRAQHRGHYSAIHRICDSASAGEGEKLVHCCCCFEREKRTPSSGNKYHSAMTRYEMIPETHGSSLFPPSRAQGCKQMASRCPGCATPRSSSISVIGPGGVIVASSFRPDGNSMILGNHSFSGRSRAVMVVGVFGEVEGWAGLACTMFPYD